MIEEASYEEQAKSYDLMASSARLAAEAFRDVEPCDSDAARLLDVLLSLLRTSPDWFAIADVARRLASRDVNAEMAASLARLIADADAMHDPAGAGTGTTPRKD